MPSPIPARSPRARLLISQAARPGQDAWVDGITARLHGWRIAVERVYTGLEAVGLAERGGLDAAILAGDVPPWDGLSMLRVIRSFDTDLPCVVVADPSKRTLQQTLALGAYSVIPQPVDVTALSRVMAGLFRKRFGDSWIEAPSGATSETGEGVVEPWPS